MLSVCLVSFMIGVLLGARFKILSICPVGFLLSIGCLVLAYVEPWTPQEALSAIMMSLVLLSAGYMVRVATVKHDAVSARSALQDAKHYPQN